MVFIEHVLWREGVEIVIGCERGCEEGFTHYKLLESLDLTCSRL